MPLNIEMMMAVRKAAELTQTKAAELAGMSAQQWNNIESGRAAGVTLDTLERIASALKITPCDLILPAKKRK